MLKVIIKSAPTLSGMAEANIAVSAFVQHQSIEVLKQVNGHWELKVPQYAVVELTVLLLGLDQIPNINILSWWVED